MITTDDEGVAERARLLRNHGMTRRYYHDLLGYNFRLSDLHAAIGLAQLPRLADLTERRRANAAYFNARLKSVITPQVKSDRDHVWHQYTVRLAGRTDRDAAAQRLAAAGVATGVFYPVPAHQQAHLRQVIGELHLPVAERLAGEVLSLPVHPRLSPVELATIVSEVNKL